MWLLAGAAVVVAALGARKVVRRRRSPKPDGTGADAVIDQGQYAATYAVSLARGRGLRGRWKRGVVDIEGNRLHWRPRLGEGDGVVDLTGALVLDKRRPRPLERLVLRRRSQVLECQRRGRELRLGASPDALPLMLRALEAGS
jgi:hypothetical protein